MSTSFLFVVMENIERKKVENSDQDWFYKTDFFKKSWFIPQILHKTKGVGVERASSNKNTSK